MLNNTSPLAISAPNQDLNFIKDLLDYKDIDAELAEKSLKKFRAHLWYLSPEASALSFFDGTVSNDTKLNMVRALKNAVTNSKPKKKFFLSNKESLELLYDKERLFC